jgi:hypothetical protein
MAYIKRVLPLLACLFVAADRPASLTIQTPPTLKIAAAVATEKDAKTTVPGSITDHGVLFPNLSTAKTYDIRLDQADKRIIQGVNLDWYDDESAKPDVGELSDDDRAAIKAIIDVPSFYNHSEILAIRGDHSRATVLVQLVRDKDFYNGSGEVVWRVELWYFKEEFGGWEKVAQQNRVLRRERFKTHDAFEAALGNVKWEPALGGIHIAAADGQLTITLNDGTPEPKK